MNNRNPIEEEFTNPEVAFSIYFQELEDRIKKIQLDLTQIKDPEIRGFAENLYLQYKKQLWELIEADIRLSTMLPQQPEVEPDQEGFVPFE